MNKKKYLKPVSGKIAIKTSHQKIWEVISQAGNLELCHPFCESNPVDSWPGKNSVDYVHYYSGLKYQRIFTDWIENIGYDLLIGKMNGRKSKVIWRINQLENSSSELTITIYPHDVKRYPGFVKSLAFIFYIRPMLKKYLNSVLKGFQFYIMKEEPVQKNQFGKHKWFSN